MRFEKSCVLGYIFSHLIPGCDGVLGAIRSMVIRNQNIKHRVIVVAEF